MSTHNIGFHEDLTKISLSYHQISSNTHLISSAGTSPLSGVDGILVLKNPHKMILKWFTPGYLCIFISVTAVEHPWTKYNWISPSSYNYTVIVTYHHHT